jgi:hypothetical protein
MLSRFFLINILADLEHTIVNVQLI